MPFIEQPLCQALVVAEQVYRDRHSGKFTLLGLFGGAWSKRFPFTIPDLMAYVALSNGQGAGKVRIELAATDDGEGVLTFVEFDCPLSHPRHLQHLAGPLGDITFQRPGDYFLVVYADGVRIHDRRFTISEGEEP